MSMHETRADIRLARTCRLGAIQEGAAEDAMKWTACICRLRRLLRQQRRQRSPAPPLVAQLRLMTSVAQRLRQH